jgi:hypothetical protein
LLAVSGFALLLLLPVAASLLFNNRGAAVGISAATDRSSPASESAGSCVSSPAHSAASENGQGRSLVIVLPAESDYLTSRAVPVAGLAFARPHGQPIGAVHVELVVGGLVVNWADLEVHSARFAGILHAPVGIVGGSAEIRVTNSSAKSSVSAVTHFSLVLADL